MLESAADGKKPVVALMHANYDMMSRLYWPFFEKVAWALQPEPIHVVAVDAERYLAFANLYLYYLKTFSYESGSSFCFLRARRLKVERFPVVAIFKATRDWQLINDHVEDSAEGRLQAAQSLIEVINELFGFDRQLSGRLKGHVGIVPELDELCQEFMGANGERQSDLLLRVKDNPEYFDIMFHMAHYGKEYAVREERILDLFVRSTWPTRALLDSKQRRLNIIRHHFLPPDSHKHDDL